MDRRAKFEQAVKDKWSDSFLFGRDTDGDYADEAVNYMWLGWQASRQAVSLPDNWRKAAEGAIDFADSGIAEHYQQTALAHIRGLAGLILSAQVEPREHEPSVTEVLPTNCRERLRKEGKKYPRSGCFSCGNSWLHSGCPNMGGGL